MSRGLLAKIATSKDSVQIECSIKYKNKIKECISTNSLSSYRNGMWCSLFAKLITLHMDEICVAGNKVEYLLNNIDHPQCWQNWWHF